MFPHIRLTALIAWSLCAAACLVALVSLTQAGESLFNLIVIPFAITAAFIVSRQPGNMIGWLLMVPALEQSFTMLINGFFSTLHGIPAQPAIAVLLMAWFLSWNWLALVFPLFLIPLLFPTGRPPSDRWRWVIFLAGALCATFLLLATISKKLGPGNDTWTIPNPIGFVGDSPSQVITILWVIGLVVMTLSSVASIFVRYRRAGNVERQQIKWLFYACTLFALSYIVEIFINSLTKATQSNVNNIFIVLFILAILAFPVSIAVAILRYHLWDIDLIIRRTLIYAALTATLGLVYFGSVVLFEQIFSGLAGESSIAIVISTLLIAALFTTLRRRIQGFIDRRFFRQKYDAARAIESFSATARNQVEFEQLSHQLVSVVEETIQPDKISLWLSAHKETTRRSE